MDNEEKIIIILNKILQAIQESTEVQSNLLNLFKAYDTEEFLADEELRNNFNDG